MEVPGLPADVFFGDAEAPPRDWREVLPDDDREPEDQTPEEREAVWGMLGFRPEELEHGV